MLLKGLSTRKAIGHRKKERIIKESSQCECGNDTNSVDGVCCICAAGLQNVPVVNFIKTSKGREYGKYS